MEQQSQNNWFSDFVRDIPTISTWRKVLLRPQLLPIYILFFFLFYPVLSSAREIDVTLWERLVAKVPALLTNPLVQLLYFLGTFYAIFWSARQIEKKDRSARAEEAAVREASEAKQIAASERASEAMADVVAAFREEFGHEFEAIRLIPELASADADWHAAMAQIQPAKKAQEEFERAVEIFLSSAGQPRALENLIDAQGRLVELVTMDSSTGQTISRIQLENFPTIKWEQKDGESVPSASSMVIFQHALDQNRERLAKAVEGLQSRAEQLRRSRYQVLNRVRGIYEEE